ncbi:MAG: RluA family pseudouridine synthase [Treponema sp.]|jgi:23S rRNA pseudouridine955/2504/2580 synthase|nr:RluA family pseudouridine synthase [Treponema sp.]
MAITLKAADDDAGRRLDRILRRALPEFPLSRLHRLLREGRILVDGRPGEAAERIRPGASIEIPGSGEGGPTRGTPPSPVPPDPAPKAGSLDILREAGGLLFLNKPPGLPVHGPESLESRVRAYLAGKLPPSLSFRPGPLHRLDKPTSGIIAFSTSLEGARYFSALLRERKVKKRYLALAEGNLDRPGVWEDFLLRDRGDKKTFPAADPGKGQKARTRVYPLLARGDYSLIMAEIETGRTHQIRAQGAIHGFPLAGDRKYGRAPLEGGFLLHACAMEFQEPGDPAPLALWAPPPERFRRIIEELFPEIAKNPGRISFKALFHAIL